MKWTIDLDYIYEHFENKYNEKESMQNFKNYIPVKYFRKFIF